MATKIRLKRFGKKRNPFYRIVVIDSRKARDGKSIEEIGIYHPTRQPSIIEVDSDRAQYWLGVGAQPSDTVLRLLKLTGDWGKFKGDKDVKSTVKPQAPKLSAEEKIAKAAEDAEKLKLAAAKKREEEKRAAEDAAKAEADAALDAATASTDADADASSSDAPTEEAPAEETPAADAPADEAPAEEN